MSRERQSLQILVFVVIAISAAFAVYSNALWNDFIWDDHIVLRSQVVAFQSAKDIFFPPEGIQQFSLHYYRPLVIASYLIDKALWGESAFGFHFTVILLHMLSTLLVFFISRIILRGFEHRDWGALMASLIFAVHPIHTESVAWMAGRADVMAAVFFFLSLFSYLKFKDKNRKLWLALSSIFFLMAALGKETALSMILLLPLIDIALFPEKANMAELSSYEKRKKEKTERREKRREKRKEKGKEKSSGKRKGIQVWKHGINIYNYIPFLMATAIYLVLRQYALQGGIQKSLQTGNVLEILKILLNSYGFYIKKIFFPVNLKAVIHEVPSDYWSTLINMIIIAFLLAGIIFSLVRKHRVILFSILFFVFTLIPSIMVAILEISETPLAERYLYIPSFSFSLFIAFIVLHIPSKWEKSASMAAMIRFILLVLVVMVLVIFSFQTVRRNTVWGDDIIFWTNLVKEEPDDGYAHLQLGIAYSKQGKTYDAIREYERAIESKLEAESRAIVFNNLGNIYSERKNYSKAEKCFKESISHWEDYPAPYYNMALLHWKRVLKDLEEDKKHDAALVGDAVEYLNRAIQLDPQYAKAHCLLGELLYRMGRYDDARKHLEAVIKYEYDKEGTAARVAKQLLDRIAAQ
jgi:tetratricopeptide (TPR) repeat protein